MNTCLIHGQMYPLGSYCPYCGPPATVTLGGTLPAVLPCVHDWIENITAPCCRKCGALKGLPQPLIFHASPGFTSEPTT